MVLIAAFNLYLCGVITAEVTSSKHLCVGLFIPLNKAALNGTVSQLNASYINDL